MFTIDIEKETLINTDYRRVIYTDKYQQLVLMSIPVGEDIPLEVHPHVSQFLRIEAGQGVVKSGKNKNHLKQVKVKDGSSVNIPNGLYHHVLNTGQEPLKLYSIYSPPEHPKETVQKMKPKKSANEILYLLLQF